MTGRCRQADRKGFRFALGCVVVAASLIGHAVQPQTRTDSGPVLIDPQRRSAEQLFEEARAAYAEHRYSHAAVLGYLSLRATAAAEPPDAAAEARVHLFLAEVMSRFQYRAMERIHAKSAMRAWERSGQASGGGPYLLRLGLVGTHGGDFPVARYYLLQALAAFEAEKPPNRQAIMSTLLALANLLLQEANVLRVLDREGVERLDEAAAYVDRVAVLAKEADDADSWLGPILELQARLLLRGSSHLPSEHGETANQMLTKAESILRLSLKLRGEDTDSDPIGRLQLLNDLISVLRRTGRYVEAMDVADRVLGITNRLQRVDVDVVSNMALVAVDLSSREMVLSMCDIVMSQEEARIAEVSSMSGEALALAFSAQARHRSAACLSLLSGSAAEDEAVARKMLDLVLRRKAVVTDAEGVFWSTLYRESDSDLQQARRELLALRNRLSTKVATGDFEGTWDLVGQIERGEELLSLEPWWRDFRAGQDDPAEQAAIKQYGEKILGGASPWDAVSSLEQPLVRENVEVGTVANALPRNAVLVEFVRVEDFDRTRELFGETARYWALVLHPDGRTRALDMGDAAEIDSGIARALEALQAADVADAAPQMAAMSMLYRLVWAPIADELKQAKRVVLSTDGALALVPFGALVGPGGRFLIEHFTLYHVASGRDLVREKVAPANPGRPAIFADPDFDAAPTSAGDRSERRRIVAIRQPLTRLDATANEGKKVGEALGGDVDFLTSTNATEGRLRSLRSPRVLHLATHGVFDEGTWPIDASALNAADAVALDAAYVTHVRMLSRSGLAAAGINVGGTAVEEDGLLTAFDVTGIDLSNTDLAVLSACDTGRGSPSIGEGVLGLRRSFRIAGVRYVVMSLWRLSDFEAERQMRAFYKEYVAGADPIDALHKMQRSRIEWFRAALDDQAPPALWGAWIVQAAPGPIKN